MLNFSLGEIAFVGEVVIGGNLLVGTNAFKVLAIGKSKFPDKPKVEPYALVLGPKHGDVDSGIGVAKAKTLDPDGNYTIQGKVALYGGQEMRKWVSAYPQYDWLWMDY